MVPVFIKKEFLHVFLAVYLLWSFAEVFFKAARDKGGVPFMMMPAWYGIIFYAVVDHLRLRWTVLFTEVGAASYIFIALFVAASAFRLISARIVRNHLDETKPPDHGPYVMVRYPVYTGFLVQLLAIGLMFGSWGAVLLTLLIGGALVHIATGQDDARQADRYGPVFEAYCRNSSRIIPFIW